jgi:hypothetical protein
MSTIPSTGPRIVKGSQLSVSLSVSYLFELGKLFGADDQDTLTAGMGTTALYSVLTPIETNTGIPLSTLNAGTGYSKSFRSAESRLTISVPT